MTKEQLADILDGREYGNEITTEEEKLAKEFGLVVIFGYSDDNVETRGAACDEIGAYEGTTLHFTPTGLLENDCDNDDCPHFAKLKEGAKKVTVHWADQVEHYAWTYETDIPHATFDILEDGEKFCRGIVFALADL